MSKNADDVLEEARTQIERVEDYLRPAAEFFHSHEGEMFGRNAANKQLAEALDIDEKTAGAVIGQLVSDKVDPVVQVASNNGRFIGVAEFHEFDGAYGYLEYDDAIGARRRVVCQKCVNDADFDKEVTHATEQSMNPESSTFKQDVEYEDLVDKIHQHYQRAHESVPTEIETGATLASGTTIGGNTAWHSGNDGNGSGLDADTVSGYNVTVSSSSPSSPNTNDIWIDTS